MAIVDNVRLLVKVSQLYYQENMSQKEISALLDISRPQICRILSSAKESGIVSIQIKNPYGDELAVERELVNTFGLKDAFVTDVSGCLGEETKEVFALRCSEQLEQFLPESGVVGVMSGQTLAAVASAVTQLNRSNLEFVPLVGGLCPQGNDISANVVARMLAQKANACYSVLNAPILMSSDRARNMLVEEPAISAVLDKWERCQVALVGIGQVSTKATSYQFGAFSDQDLEELRKTGAVASLAVSYLNADGEIIDSSITRRSIGWTLKKRRRCKVIAFAYGQSKLDSVLAALKGNYVDVLMTTAEFARQLLTEAKVQGYSGAEALQQ
ncbi:MAG TPA: transcriptional regulator [Candidatus Fournierella excrementavium]|nr:transcriptional regulator [Candidatus Fournierella excrementavium]